MTEPTGIKVYCDDRSHEPKVVTVDVLTRNRHGIVVSDMRTIDTSDESPAKVLPQMQHDAPRGRVRLRCKLCSLTVELRPENAAKVYDGLAGAGVSEIRLSALAATL